MHDDVPAHVLNRSRYWNCRSLVTLAPAQTHECLQEGCPTSLDINSVSRISSVPTRVKVLRTGRNLRRQNLGSLCSRQ
jgi:hypothetical protein